MFYLILLIFSLVLILFFLFFSFLKKRIEVKTGESLKLMQGEISNLRLEMGQGFANFVKSLQETTGQVNLRLDNAAAVIRDVSKSLGKVEEGTRQVLEIGKDISHLEEILSVPKARGILGELGLEAILSQCFPANYYRMQYEFKNRERCDAVLFVGKRLLPIDAKFPLEDFQRIIETDDKEERRRRRKDFLRRVRGHIDDIARKYIRPEEGTFDFAFIYIPAENVYYEMITKEEGEESLSSYALSKRVIPVSPNSFYAYLQAILLGLKGLEIEKRAEEILSYIHNLSLELSRFREDFDTLGKHLSNALSKYQEADKKFSRLEERFSQTEALDKEAKGYLP